jgi:ferrous iron transport protein A
MRLGDVPPGGYALLEAPDVPTAMARRLAELGLRAGERVQVMHRTAGGGRLLAVGDTRIAVDRQTARAIPVRPGDADAADPSEAGPS